jgi:GntR family transcriptional regulator, rspAB operon transcriptional repressor
MSRSPRVPGFAPREPSLVPSLYRDLRERIVSVALPPGEAVSEARIAEGYGVSRTPVREAFKRLAEDGFLEVVPQVGSFVARIDLRLVRDSHFVRETLECRIVELAAARIDAPHRALLRDNVARQRRALAAHDAAGFFAVDEAMHELLAAIAGHRSAWQVIHSAKAQLDRVRHLSLQSAGRSRLRMAEHRAIAECVVAGDGAGAVAAMRTHLATIFDAIANIAAENAHFFTDSGADADARRGAVSGAPQPHNDRHAPPPPEAVPPRAGRTPPRRSPVAPEPPRPEDLR